MAKKQHDDVEAHEHSEADDVHDPVAEQADTVLSPSKDAPFHPFHDGCTVCVKASAAKHPDDANRHGKLVKIEPDGRCVIEFKDANSYNHGYRIADLNHVE